MKRKSPFDRLTHDIDVALLEAQTQYETLLLNGEIEKMSTDFTTGYIYALRWALARAHDIRDQSAHHITMFLNEKWEDI